MGGAPADARPHRDGLEVTRLLPPPEHVPYLFDTNGNAGTTAWWDGRIVGCWVQDEEGVVRLSVARGRGPAGLAALELEAQRLTAWLDGTVIGNVYASRQMKHAKLP